MGDEALVVPTLVNFIDGGEYSDGFLAVVASAVDYGAGGGRDASLVAVIFGVGAWAVCGCGASGTLGLKILSAAVKNGSKLFFRSFFSLFYPVLKVF